MATTYRRTNTDSALPVGADFRKAILPAASDATGSQTIPVANGTTRNSFGYTDVGVPGTSGVTGDYTVELNITTGATDIHASVAVARVNSAGTQQSISAFTAEQIANAGTLTFSLTAINLGTWASGDRLRVTYRLRSSRAHGGPSEIIVTHGGVNNEVVAPWTVAQAYEEFGGDTFTVAQSGVDTVALSELGGDTFAVVGSGTDTFVAAPGPGGAAPTFVGAETAIDTGTSGTTLTISVPAGTVNGDLMILQVISRQAQSALDGTWTLINYTGADSGTRHGYLYWRYAASEPASYVYTQLGVDGGRMAGAIAVYRYDDAPVDPVDQFAWAGTDNTVAPSVTTTQDNALVVRLWDFTGNGATVTNTVPAPNTQRYTTTSSVTTRPGVLAGDSVQATLGASGTATMGDVNTVSNRAFTLALFPSVGGGPMEEFGSTSFTVDPAGVDTQATTDLGGATFEITAAGIDGFRYSDTGGVTFTVDPTGVDAVTYQDAGGVAFEITAAGVEQLALTEAGSVTFEVTVAGVDTRAGTDAGSVAFTITPNGVDNLELPNAYEEFGGIALVVAANGVEAITFLEAGSATFTVDTNGVDSTAASELGAVQFTIDPTGVDVLTFVEAGSVAFTVDATGVDTRAITELGSVTFAVVASGEDTYSGPAAYEEFGGVTFEVTSAGVDDLTMGELGSVTFEVTSDGLDTAAFADPGTVTFAVIGLGSDALETGNSYDDFGGIQLTVTPSGIEGLGLSDAGSVSFTIDPSGEDSVTSAYQEFGSVAFTVVTSGVDGRVLSDVGSVSFAVVGSGVEVWAGVELGSVPFTVDATGVDSRDLLELGGESFTVTGSGIDDLTTVFTEFGGASFTIDASGGATFDGLDLGQVTVILVVTGTQSVLIDDLPEPDLRIPRVNDFHWRSLATYLRALRVAILTLMSGKAAAVHTHPLSDISDYPPAGYRYGGRVSYAASGAFAKADYPGLAAVRVRVQGSGGAGGGRTAGGAGTRTIGQGGGGGGYVEKFINAVDLVASETVTVGVAGLGVSGAAGGNGNASSFGAHCNGSGGDGGVMTTDSQYTIWQPADAAAGGASGGDFMVPGTQGFGARNFGNVARYDGANALIGYQGLFTNGRGGNSFLGLAGSAAPDGATGATGGNPSGYGYGGNGLAGNNNANAAGADGGPGMVSVDLYYTEV